MGYQYGGRNTRTFVKLPGYKDLVVWQKGSDLADLIYAAVGTFGPGHYRLKDQMLGAAISVPANIAEGYCTSSLANYIRYCLIARGSLGELGSYLQECERWGLIGGETLAQIIAFYADTSYLLDRLIASLRKKQQDGDWDQQFWVKEERATYTTDPNEDNLGKFPQFPQFPESPEFPDDPEFSEFLQFPDNP